MTDAFLHAIQNRHSCYQISEGSPIADSRILELLQQAVQYTPSSFHMQSSRAVLLLGTQHKRLWEIVLEALRPTLEEKQAPATEKKIASFAAGHGTILFFDDTAVTGKYAEQYPLYAQNFPIWSQQSNGMLQFSIWNLLEIEGLGASLQHYNPLIDSAVRQEWSLPESWMLIAQMPFGAPTGQPVPKQYQDIHTRVFSFD